MLIDRQNWRLHRGWMLLTALLAVGATFWYFRFSQDMSTWPGGGSLPGFTFGVAGGLVILFEMLLWWRKQVRTWRIGRTQAWMRAHIWLGLLTVPLLVYHSGFRLGGPLSTVLMVLFLIVVVSGVWGLVMQQYLPRRMLDTVPAETIYSQIDYVVGQYCEEADRLVLATCGPAEGEATATAAAADGRADDHLTIGAVRSAGRVQGKVLLTQAPAEPVEGTEPLRDFYRSDVRPFLRGGAASGSALQQPNRAAVMFHDLKVKVAPKAHGAVDALEGLCDQRRQFETQARLHFWLHNWLWIHLPLSVALVVLMFVHIWVALKYW